MAEQRYLIAITPEEIVEREGDKITALLDAGWRCVHLRHPSASRTDMRTVIESIKPQYHKRLVLHGHFDLTNDFNLGGLHLNRRCPVAPPLYNGPVSRSCHSVEEIAETQGMEYVTLSPVFDSISKSGYHSAFTREDLRGLAQIDVPVIALGGISPATIDELGDCNFSGYAMLGAIPWDKTVDDVKSFARECKSLISKD